MKHLKIAGLCLVAMLVMSMAAAATASAAPVWEQCRENAGTGTKWSDNGCKTASPTGKWEWKELTTTEKVKSSATLQLADIKVPLVGRVEVHCSGEDIGVIGPGKFDKITEIPQASIKCTAGENCQEFKKVEPRNLPWQTELFETEGKIRDAIQEDGKGAPGWKVTCRVLGIEKGDECTNKTGTTAVATEASGSILLVLATFDTKSGKAKCEVGGAESGEVLGPVANFSSEGWSIRAH